jgi:HK97 gp10 family phage protein
MRGETTFSGNAELQANLRSLGKATGRNTLKRVGTKMLEPMRDRAKAAARRRSGDLERSIKIGTKLARSQAGGSRNRAVAGGGFRATAKNSVDLHMGPGQNPQAITEEFGKFNQAPHPFMRPAFDAEANAAVLRAGEMLWAEVSKSVAKRARKLAKAAM